MVQHGAPRPTLTHRLAIVLAIFGLIQTLVPTLLRHARSTLIVSIRFPVSTPGSEIGPITAPVTEAEWESESSEESTGSNDVLELESLTWLEGTTPRRWVHMPRIVTPFAFSVLTASDTGTSERGRQSAWNLGLFRSTPVPLSAQLCRFLC